MSGGDEVDKLDELTNKVNRLNKNVKTILEMLQTLEEKLKGNKKEDDKEENKENDVSPETRVLRDKEKMDKIFAKKQIGRPVGTWESKREQYADMLNKGKIGQPKESTLEYYKIAKVMDTYVLIARDD